MHKPVSLGMRAGLCLLLATITSTALAQVTVKISSPASGTVGTTVTINASATSPNGVSGWYIYVDNNAAWNTPGPTSSIAAPLTLAVGTHNVVVRAWDNTGAHGDGLLTLNAVQTTVTGVTVTTSAPGNGASVTSPVTFSAAATSPNGIAGWVVYCDFNNVYQVDNYSNTLTAPVTLATGSHSCFVRAWDRVSGYGSSTAISINVVQATVQPASSGTTVTVNSPGNGASTTSPVSFSASATSPNGISGWVIYANNNNVYQVDNNSNTLNASVSLAPGTYSVYIRAWDKVSGYGTSPAFTITVGSASTPSSNSALPTPPSNAVVIRHIEDSTNNWNSCSDCAGGDTVTNDFWTAPFQTTPSLDGSSREFYVGGPPWTAALFYHTVWDYRGQYNYATHFLSDYWVYVDPTSMQYVWDLEYDVYQALSGWEYMMGTHCVFGSGQTGQYWEIYSQADHRWKATNVPCSRNIMPAGQWHHIQWMMERDPNSHAYTYKTLVVNGTAYQLNNTQYADPIDWGDTLGVQWQIDTNSLGGSAHQWIDKATFTIW